MTDLMTRVAWMYYKQEKTQQEIADRLGLSRIKVLRLLKEAREIGIVHIEIRTSHTNLLVMEEKLRDIFSLNDVVLIEEINEEEVPYHGLAAATASYLQDFLKDGMLVGIGMCRTLYLTAQYVAPDSKIDCTFISLTGGLTQVPNGYENQNIILNIANAFSAKAIYMMAPFVVSNPSIKQALQHEDTIQNILDNAKRCDVAVTSLGSIDAQSSIFQYTQSGISDLQEIKAKGGKGDVLGRFFNENGQELDVALRNRTIGINIQDFLGIPTRIIVAGGALKRDAIMGALRGSIPTVLISDEHTAAWLLKKSQEEN